MQSSQLGSAPASGAVRRAPAPNSEPADKPFGGHHAGMPTARAPLAAPEAGALPIPNEAWAEPGNSSSFVRFFLSTHIIFMKTNGHRR